jgi:hypothetical protein
MPTPRPAAIGMKDWSQLIDEAAAAAAVAEVKALRRRCAAWPQPLDLAGAPRTKKARAALEAALDAAVDRLDARIRAADPAGDLCFELCCLRDLVCTT